MLSGNKYTSRSSLGSAKSVSPPKEEYLSAFRDCVKRVVSVKGEYFEGL